jgi:hypothetical protein
MPGLVPGIHVLEGRNWKDVDGRDTLREDALRAFAGHDEGGFFA